MELLLKAGAVKLKSHLDKFLVADEDKETVRQSRNGLSKRAIWIIEPCPKNPDAIRIKSLCTGLYLTASDTPFLLGMTGKRVVQLSIFDPTRVEWEPVNDGFQVKFRSSKERSYLRGNGGTPPWRNSITHDVPLTGGTYNWVLWDVEPVSLPDLGSFSECPSPMTSFNSVLSDEFNGYGSYPGTPVSARSTSSIWSPELARRKSGMDLFRNAKTIRLKSHHDKYLAAEDDEESVTQERNGSSKNVKWVVDFVDDGTAIRLKSCYGKYLTASNHPFLLGMTGRKVLQTLPRRLDSSLEWEPVKEGSELRLRTRYGNYLRANGGLPPWRNSITHDVPHRTATQDWVLWEVDILEIREHSEPDPVKKSPGPGQGQGLGQVKVQGQGQMKVNVGHSDSFGSDSSSVSKGSSEKFQRQESTESGTYSPPKPDARLIYYCVADDLGNVNEAECNSFTFKGNSVADLTRKLVDETGHEDIFVCTRSPLNKKLYPLRLQLPPNTATMHIVVVPSTSKLAEEFEKMGI